MTDVDVPTSLASPLESAAWYEGSKSSGHVGVGQLRFEGFGLRLVIADVAVIRKIKAFEANRLFRPIVQILRSFQPAVGIFANLRKMVKASVASPAARQHGLQEKLIGRGAFGASR